MPQFGQFIIAEATPGAVVNVAVGALAMRHRASHRADSRHVVGDIEPDEPTNMSVLLAFEWSQASPQS